MSEIIDAHNIDDSVSELAGLFQVSQAMCSSVSRDELLEMILGMALLQTGATCGSILLKDDSGRYLRIVSSVGLSEEVVRSVRVRVGEGIHRDDETYTAQHLIARHNIGDGINYFYGSGPEPMTRPQAVWKQQCYFDSYYFDRSLWHSVSPIVSGKRDGDGHRDVILIDFVSSSKVD